MSGPKLSKLELQIMETLWTRGEVSIREIQESFPEKSRPSYGTIQITIYRMEEKKIVRRTRKVGNFHLFEPLISRDAAQLRLIDELVAMFGGRSQLVMMHLVRSGKLRLEDVNDISLDASTALAPFSAACETMSATSAAGTAMTTRSGASSSSSISLTARIERTTPPDRLTGVTTP